MNQGDVYWYTFKQPDKRRPVLILTRTSAISYLTSITVAPLTTAIRGIPTEVILTPDDGVETACAVNLDNLQTISKSNIGAFITRMPTEKMHKVRLAISFALGFDALT